MQTPLHSTAAIAFSNLAFTNIGGISSTRLSLDVRHIEPYNLFNPVQEHISITIEFINRSNYRSSLAG